MLLFIHIKEEEKELYMKWGNGVMGLVVVLVV